MADEASTNDQQNPTVAVDPAPEVAMESAVATPTAAEGDRSALATGTVTPALSDIPLNPEQRSLSLKVSLADLSAKATALYAHKNYEEAAEVYAQAAEMQAEMNGEMSPENAEILFLYGRSLFKVGQSKSDVLGGKAPEQQKKKAAAGEKKKGKANGSAVKTETAEASGAAAQPAAENETERVAEEAVAIIVDEKEGEKKTEEGVEAKKPLFQFTGDENFDDSDEEEQGGEEEEGEGEDEEDDDLAMAFEILDLARVLFNKKLEEGTEAAADDKGKEKAEGDTPATKHIKERLADTHDLLAEISLENERYPNAIVDSRKSLEYKKQLYPEESEVIAEAHFKLSLALEFASVTSSSDEDDKSGPQPVDQDLREEAAKELEAAIASTKLKLQNKEVELATLHSPEDNDITRKQIAEVKDIIADMEQRLVDLRKPPIDVNAALAGSDPMGGILGAALGESAAQTEARIEEAKKTATDLTGLVRKKAKEEPKPTAEEAKTNGHESNGKRKAEEPAEAPAETKKARVDEAQEA
ncbi:putative histone h1-binding protein [Phaeoacremonium minimum UCRPA7]|uniref:Putative histone h1-binding protein n=1 Tax=Phaeoacremonium minimum (strain UCR-PA7) TaxID=1286976 RepID=R8BJ61_PHAM7|nr:putative histone h1-binding protein [Phaeoacremonium minimum UCRPA7]EON99309.1 putative histone h1-binding protein [Phaeoacremonium minimum UCRPA7]